MTAQHKSARLFLAGVSLFVLGGMAHAAAPDQDQSPAAVPLASGASAAVAADAADIIVTGSRTIKNGNSSPSPVTIVSTQDALRVQPGGTLADALNNLPVFAGSRGPISNPSSTGTAAAGNGAANQLNLRNLGSNRTLILLDGNRVPPTTANGIVDVDIIPQLLVQRVDTVTGGVSAVYGSDAVAGVVNYVIDRKFSGVSASITRGVSQRGDAQKTDAAIAAGTSLFGGRGHIEASYEYIDEQGILRRSDRSWLNKVGVSGAGTTANPYTLNTNVHQAGLPFGGLVACGTVTAGVNNCALNGQTFGTDGVLRPFVHGTATGTAALEIGGDGGYYDSSLIAPLTANQLFARFDFDVTDNVHFYAQVSGDLKTNKSYADLVQLSGSTFSATNAFLPTAYQQVLAVAHQTTFKLSELVNDLPRLAASANSHQWLYMTGLTGKLDGFTWGVNYTHGVTILNTTLETNPNNQHLAAALDAVRDPATGKIVCNASLTNSAYANCVPIDVFGPTAVSQAAADYVTQPTHYHAVTKLDDVSAHIEGSPFSTWAGPVNVALSGEYRELSFRSTSDAQPGNADCTSLRYNCVSGAAGTQLWAFSFAASPKVSQQVREGAFEADVPLIKDLPFIRSFDINGAARYTSYDTSGKYWTWKVGADWHVTDNFRFRGTISRDIRAPTLYELFAPLNSVPVKPVDLLTGLSPQVPSTDQSNPNLKAEIGKTITGGFVWMPTHHLSVALDYYHLQIDDAVVQVAGSTPAYQQACYASNGTSPFCALQQRPNGFADKSAANAVTRWLTLYMNIGQIKTYGADLEINYSSSLFDRPASIRLLGDYQPHVYYKQTGVPTTDQGGVAFGPIGLGAGPALRLTGFVHVEPVNHLSIDLLERWRSHMKLGGDPTQVWADNRIDSFATTNITITRDFKTSFGSAQLFLNVSNLFDQNPPVGGYSGNGTRAGLRDGFALGDDPTGRYFAVGVKAKF